MPHLLLLWIRPCSLRYLKAENCESLERLDSSSYFKDVGANFGNCFKLNQEVIRTCRLRPYLVKKCPYKACVLVVNNKGDAEVCDRKEELDGYYCIKDKQNGTTSVRRRSGIHSQRFPLLKEHLHVRDRRKSELHVQGISL